MVLYIYLLYDCVVDMVLYMLRELGRGYQALCCYNCQEAISILSSVPAHHYNTGWVLTHIGRAYFELAEYTQVGTRGDPSVSTLFPYHIQCIVCFLLCFP